MSWEQESPLMSNAVINPVCVIGQGWAGFLAIKQVRRLLSVCLIKSVDLEKGELQGETQPFESFTACEIMFSNHPIFWAPANRSSGH